MYKLCCVVKATNLVNNYQPRKSARTFVSRLELAINYIRCYMLAFINLISSFSLGLGASSSIILPFLSKSKYLGIVLIL